VEVHGKSVLNEFQSRQIILHLKRFECSTSLTRQ